MKELDITPILNALNIRHQVLHSGQGKAYIISLFDDSFFTQSDFDIIDGKTRNLILAGMKKRKFTIKGSRLFTSPTGQNYQFAKPSHTLGCNPADKVKEVLNDNVVTFATPTQTILLMAINNSPLLKDENFLKRFLLEQPANIQKIWQWVEHDNLKGSLIFSKDQLNDWNEQGAKKAQGKV